MTDQSITLQEAEKRCAGVRLGDEGLIEELSSPFLERSTGILSLFRKDRRKEIDSVDLLASFEALSAKGHYNESPVAIEELLERPHVDDELRRIALARVGQTAVMYDLPLDLGPIISELGLSRKDLKSALEHFLGKRKNKDPLMEMEINILQSLLLDRQADHVESARLSGTYLKAAMDGFDLANSLGTQIKRDLSGYHLTRCVLHTARFLLRRGDHPRGIDGIEACIKRCRRGGYKPLLLRSLLVKGEYIDDEDEAETSLKEALNLARSLINIREEARALSIMGSRECAGNRRNGPSSSCMEKLSKAADLAKEAGDDDGAAAYRLESALWHIRYGNNDRGLEEARKVYRSLEPGTDPEKEIMALTLILYAHLENEHRKKAKGLLLDLITNYPVKQYPQTFGILKEAVLRSEWLRRDKDTKELFEDEMVYRIKKDAVKEIITRAKESYPNEFGAMLRGIEEITHIEPLMEGAGNRRSFLFSLYSRFSQRDLEGEGVVHSHPSGSARPSRADLSMFGRFPGINIIIGYPYTEDSIAAYDRLGNRVAIEIVQ
ncbi:MAG: Mov34/MPN/PAD-1 family protein [Thermoplasmatota archaeon]